MKRELKVEPDLNWVADEEVRKRIRGHVSHYKFGEFECPHCGYRNPNPFDGLPVKPGKTEFKTQTCGNPECAEPIQYKVERGMSTIARDQTTGMATMTSTIRPKRVPKER